MAETSSSQRPWWKASLSTWARTKGGTAEEVSIVVAIAAIGALCVRLGSCVEPSTSTSSAIAYHRFGVVPGPLFRNGTASPRNSRILPSICQR